MICKHYRSHKNSETLCARQTHTLMSDKTRYDGNFYTMLFEPVPP
jgi:hypothetical protein